MMERMMGIGMPPSVGKYRPEQIAQISTWDSIPESERITTHMNKRKIAMNGTSTETQVNPLDPGDGVWYDKPAARGTVHHAGIWK